MVNFESIIAILEEWLKTAKLERAYLFGSIINSPELFYDDSDIDLVVPINQLNAEYRCDVLSSIFSHVGELEIALLQCLQRNDSSKPISSILAVTPIEISCDIHKSAGVSFFSGNKFLQLPMQDGIAANSLEADQVPRNMAVELFEKIQKYRNDYLKKAPNGQIALKDYDGIDVLPKELMRYAAIAESYILEDEKSINTLKGYQYIQHIIRERNTSEARQLADTIATRALKKPGMLLPAISRDNQIYIWEILYDLILEKFAPKQFNQHSDIDPPSTDDSQASTDKINIQNDKNIRSDQETLSLYFKELMPKYFYKFEEATQGLEVIGLPEEYQATLDHVSLDKCDNVQLIEWTDDNQLTLDITVSGEGLVDFFIPDSDWIELSSMGRNISIYPWNDSVSEAQEYISTKIQLFASINTENLKINKSTNLKDLESIKPLIFESDLLFEVCEITVLPPKPDIRHKYIISLESSINFKETHKIIDHISDIEFTPKQYLSILEAAVTNSQIYLIINDDDVRELIEKAIENCTEDPRKYDYIKQLEKHKNTPLPHSKPTTR